MGRADRLTKSAKTVERLVGRREKHGICKDRKTKKCENRGTLER